MSNFERAVSIVLAEEGGYVNDPRDPGGETNFGISKRQYPDVDIATLNVSAAKEIYRRDYWDVCKCDYLPWPLCLFVFDAAVNQGCDAQANFAAQKMLQRALDVPQDGILGLRTMAAAAKARPWHAARFMAFRAMRYQSTRNFDRFGEGWLIRLFRVAMEAGE